MAGPCGDILDENNAEILDETGAIIWDELGPCDHSVVPVQAGGAGAFRGGRRRRAEYINHFRELERKRRRNEEIERLEAQEREALAKAEAAAQALEDAEATDRANAQYEQTIARLAALSDEAERVLEAITRQREQAEQEAEDEETAIALLLLN